jgi:Transposase family tnp2
VEDPAEVIEPMDGLQNEPTELVEAATDLEADTSEQLDTRNEVNSTQFFKIIKDNNKDLFPGCPKSKLSVILELMHIKCMKNLDGEGFEMILQWYKNCHPGVDLPNTYYECKKLIKALGLGYEKIHACPNNCMLFWKEYANEEICHVCHASRWESHENTRTFYRKANCIPAKVLRYFPLIPRLQRLFMSTKTADDMRWHSEKRVNDGKLRHPADGEAWNEFDARYPDFSMDVRNLRLGLSTDGFNPFGTMSSQYSNWLVVLIPYNLPPWISMKQQSLILSLMIPGPTSPSQEIDVFLQPLIDDLRQLWVGVETYDASNKENFKMRASLMWTVSDFPALSMLSGWAVKGYKACPKCEYEHWHFDYLKAKQSATWATVDGC